MWIKGVQSREVMMDVFMKVIVRGVIMRLLIQMNLSKGH